ncbi:MAG TPA: DUF2062 domain-containing protein [Burkholderiales bacterium]
MPRRLIRRYLPDTERLRRHRSLRFLGRRLQEPNLWRLNRTSAARAAAIGLFMAFVPMPFQMVPAALLAVCFGANLPVSAAFVWITNPLTMPPVFYFCYRIGARLTGTPPQPLDFELSLAWLGTELARVWQPFLVGCLVVATAAALLGYYGMRALWRWQVLRQWTRRTEERRRSLRRTLPPGIDRADAGPT